MDALRWHIVDFFQALVAGLLVGGTYGLMCVGLGIIFGVMRVVNFAQGDFMMLGMYVTYYLVTGFGILAFLGPYVGPVAGAALAGPIVFGIGWLLHTAWDILHHLYGNPLLPFSATSSLITLFCSTLTGWSF